MSRPTLLASLAPHLKPKDIELRSALAKHVRPWIACWPVFLPGVVGFFVAMSIACTRWPVPSMHDDFGNLLIANTLLEGRFCNPVPAAWQSMETFHIVFQPTYAAKFPIGLGALLATGKILLGSYVAGLWICAGLGCSAIAWMTMAHFPRRWGIAAGLFAALHPCWQNGWSQEFTNGWLAITGVAIVFGGLLRIRRTYRNQQLSSSGSFDSRLTALVGLGCVTTLFSRPFEGGIVCGLLGLYFLPTLVARRLLHSPQFWRATIPGFVILGSGICVQLAVNHSITGQVMQLPYQLHETQYGVAPVLIWQKPNEPTLGHRFAEQAKFHSGWSMDEFRKAASFQGYFTLLETRVGFMVNHWGRFLAFAPVCLLVLGSERRRTIGLLGLLLFSLLVINCIPWAMPQYVSPMIPIAIFIACTVARGITKRLADTWKLSSMPVRLELSCLGCILLFQCGWTASTAYARSCYQGGWGKNVADHRAAMVLQLEADPGADLVFVKYEPNHNVHFEWVFNEATPDRASVVWARWSSPEMNQCVLASYPNRKCWMLQFDESGAPMLRESKK